MTILIGANALDVFLQLEVRRGNPSQPYAIKTILGWSLLGNTNERERQQKDQRKYHINHIEVLQHGEILDQIVRRFWETEDCLKENAGGTAMRIEHKKDNKKETINTSDKTWHLLHHPVFHLQKPGKVRVVFDATAKYKDKTLNKELFTGPDLLNSLIGYLFDFETIKLPLLETWKLCFTN